MLLRYYANVGIMGDMEKNPYTAYRMGIKFSQNPKGKRTVPYAILVKGKYVYEVPPEADLKDWFQEEGFDEAGIVKYRCGCSTLGYSHSFKLDGCRKHAPIELVTAVLSLDDVPRYEAPWEPTIFEALYDHYIGERGIVQAATDYFNGLFGDGKKDANPVEDEGGDEKADDL